jgi:two-component system, NtrC family, sensor kinase
MTCFSINKPIRLSQITALGFYAMAASSSRAADLTPSTSDILMVLIAILVILQSFLIIGLQHSRLKNKGARNTLIIHQKDLEQKIQERTQNLHHKNIELETAIENQKTIALQLLDTKRHLQTIINSVPDILVGISAEEKVTYWNTAAFEKTGLSFDKALGTHILNALPQLPITQEQLSAIILSERPFINQRIQHVENDEYKFYDLRIYPLLSAHNAGAVIQLTNVTKQVQIENMMIQNEKMSSLGELAAGIAHEINNPLGIILHNVQNISRRISTDFPSNKKTAEKYNINSENILHYLREREIPLFLNNIKEAGERAGTIVNNMLEFSRTSHNEKTWIDIKKLIDQSVELNSKSNFDDQKAMESILVTTQFQQNLPMVYASAPELQQVLLNLLRNAYQALLSKNFTPPETPQVNILVMLNTLQREIMIEIADNGPGIKSTIKEHIFQPFFTTKGIGKGTGLGLSVSYFIITEHHQGRISVLSHYGKGARFKLCLPVLAEQQYALDI